MSPTNVNLEIPDGSAGIKKTLARISFVDNKSNISG